MSRTRNDRDLIPSPHVHFALPLQFALSFVTSRPRRFFVALTLGSFDASGHIRGRYAFNFNGRAADQILIDALTFYSPCIPLP